MIDPRAAERWLAIVRQEESHLARLIEILQADQRAVARAQADEIEGNLRLKEAVLAEMQVSVEARRSLLESIGRAPGAASRTFDDLAGELPPAFREQGKAALDRVRSLRSALSELNDLTRRIMVHGLMLVRSTLGLIQGDGGVPVYGGKGDFRPSGATGRLVRQNV